MTIVKNGKSNLNLMLADFCYFNRFTLKSRYTPLNIGLLAQYINQEFGKNISISLYKSVDKFLNQAKENPPDIVGLAIYFWNTALNQYVVKNLREMFGEKVVIVLGGPSIDNDKLEQYKFLTEKFPGANASIVNEGEIGFGNIIRKMLSDEKNLFKDPINGIYFVHDNKLIQGSFTGLNLDLSTLGSPYLSGFIDDFMDSDYQPLIQTSRFCPYTCAFCVSGKNQGKLRGYPVEQVKEELNYVSKKYADRPQHTMYIADENFGILKKDIDIAEHIKKCKKDFGFPQGIFFYNDKRFTKTSQRVFEALDEINTQGLTIGLQSENPETLKAINRRNITEGKIKNAINWANHLGISTTTELIFGLPYETRESFVDLLNRTVKRGFDSVLCHNLFIMDGIELNRPSIREKYGIKTKYRLLATNYGSHKESFFAEYEEVVVGTNTFSYEDFIDIRNQNLMFYTVFALGFQKWFFQFVRSLDVSLSEFFSSFFKPDRKIKWPNSYLKFLHDFKFAVKEELNDSPNDVIAKAKKIYDNNNNDVSNPSRINQSFGARLIYLENKWIKKVLLYHLDKIMKEKLTNEDKNLAASLINLAERERIDLRNVTKKEPLNFSYDVIEWKKNNYKKPLRDLKMPKRAINFLVDEARVIKLSELKKRFSSSDHKELCYAAIYSISTLRFKSYLLHILQYRK
jgi:radical SAM superfamily enzyme YgiQ (UPF0313 family)